LPLERRPGDARELALRLREPHLHHDAERHARARQRHEARLRNAHAVAESLLGAYRRTGRALRVGEGFHAAEVDEGQSFRWMARRGRLGLPPSPAVRFLEMQVRSHTADLTQHLALRAEGAEPLRLPLVEGWNTVSFQVGPGIDSLTLEADRTVPPSLHPGDGRELAVQVRWPLLHEDAQRHAHVSAQHANRALNYREMLEGATELASTPWRLGIDMVGSCNVKPPCVYCNWDEVKEQEGQAVDLPFNLQTLREYGPLFERASELVNCSIGEPFMMREIDLLLDVFGSRGKLLELTTNGQILTETNIRKLLGRNAHLYISLDAATAETYARLRNRTFPRLLENVRRLVQAKGGRGQLPLVYLVFMPMRANLHEVDAFVELCAELQADRLVLRPLNASGALDLVWEREGYRFDYQRELLPFEELVRVSGRVAELCRRLGVELSDQMDMGGRMADEFASLFEEGRRQAAQAPLRVPGATPAPLPAWGTADAPVPGPAPEAPALDAPPAAASAAKVQVPICTEPWTSLYVLRRGTLPCCYGGTALAPMTGFKDVWNSPVVQDIRRDLAAGRFHRYCLESQDCPIVRKAAAGHALPVRQSALLAARRGLARL
ncbi:MAG TPA: radical SAM/SPASM domain-containing protein, partial [Vicinamibacteria bacterium]|nr:radical SAM/SPASM domain-containing protein [Vicinamibacteria bacterium]